MAATKSDLSTIDSSVGQIPPTEAPGFPSRCLLIACWLLPILPVIAALLGLSPTLSFLRRARAGEPRFLTCKAHRGDWLFLLASAPIAILFIASTFPPGSLWGMEGYGYDVMEYHLQLP